MSRLRRILFLSAPILLAVIIFGYCYGYHQTRQQPIVFTAPKAAAVEVRTEIPWGEGRDGDPLRLDLYRLPGSEPLPVVIVVHGDGPESVIEDFKDWGQVTSWGRNIAAYGLAAVTFDHSTTEMLKDPETFADEVDRLIAYVRGHAADLGIDADRLGILTLSSASPFGLRSALRDRPPYLRCVVVFYGAMSLEAFPGDRAEGLPPQMLQAFDLLGYLEGQSGPLPAFLLVRGARDFEALNRGSEAFAERARAAGAEVEELVHPTGDHAFDLGSGDLESRRIIRRALDFLVEHLDRSQEAEEEDLHQEPVDGTEDRPE